jgi:hypothetical protein
MGGREIRKPAVPLFEEGRKGHTKTISIYSHGATVRSGSGPPRYRSFTITLGRILLDKWSAWRKDLYLTTHTTRNRNSSMPLAQWLPNWGSRKKIEWRTKLRVHTSTYRFEIRATILITNILLICRVHFVEICCPWVCNWKKLGTTALERFKTLIPAGKRLQMYSLDRTANEFSWIDLQYRSKG